MKEFNKNKQGGFTLIELMVVVVVISILAAIAIPNYISLRYRALEASVKSNMHTMQAAVEEFNTLADGSYPGDLDTRVGQVNPGAGPAVAVLSLAARTRVPPFPPTALLRPHPGLKNPFTPTDNVVENLLVAPPPVPPAPPAGPRGCIYYSGYQIGGVAPSIPGQAAQSYIITGYGSEQPIQLVLP